MRRELTAYAFVVRSEEAMLVDAVRRQLTASLPFPAFAARALAATALSMHSHTSTPPPHPTLGVSYTIVRPGGLHGQAGGVSTLITGQGDNSMAGDHHELLGFSQLGRMVKERSMK